MEIYKSFAKICFLLSGIFFLLGILAILARFLPWLPKIGKLPGDIVIKKENFEFYFPWISCLILSVLLSVILKIFYYFNSKR